jgi:mono/diheme cytochrome c family protein/rhodanese-related sulfurtransferase
MRARSTLFTVALSAVALSVGVFSGCHRAASPHAAWVARGRELYGRMCSVCHGDQGQGYKADEAPRLASAEFLASATDAYLKKAIAGGRAGTTMSAWSKARGGPLGAPDVDALLQFIRSWQHDPALTLDERPLTGNATRGGLVFAQYCERCHGAQGVGGPYVHVGNPGWLATASNGFLRAAVRRGRAGTPMPAFERTLSSTQIEDVVALLRSWEVSPPRTFEPRAEAEPIPLGPVPLHPRGPAPAGFKKFPATTPADVVKAALDHGARLALLDARAPSAYAIDHIAGAVSVPFYDPKPYFSKLPKDAWLVCYCSCPHAESGELASKLEGAGFTKVAVLAEGFGVWKARKYPAHTGRAP